MVHEDYIKQELEGKSVLPWKLWDMIVKEGIQTGSSVYSSAKPKDLDYILNLPPSVFEGYTVGNPSNYWKGKNGFTILYAKSPMGEIVNLILFSDAHDMQVWIKTTEIMKRLFQDYFENEFNDKYKRVRIFRALNDIMYNREPMKNQMTSAYAVKHSVCKICGREAINFTNAVRRRMYLETGICEPCQNL